MPESTTDQIRALEHSLERERLNTHCASLGADPNFVGPITAARVLTSGTAKDGVMLIYGDQRAISTDPKSIQSLAERIVADLPEGARNYRANSPNDGRAEAVKEGKQAAANAARERDQNKLAFR